jgi:hypothetical protein
MNKQLLIIYIIDFVLVNNDMTDKDIKDLVEWMNTLTIEELSEEFLNNIEYLSH